ncbi:glycerol-3-phosphate 1-O-acyltransferase PlsY [Mesomycoplasma neurolyticum]|uniref:Glycerol-3-phosphate acyltransferase n=1 Tax=Mesomycoplasma neurolyticum TaxID=2120 RepID=A0A449A5C1_9BACT|nr:glycerol-3-phosphate 1-O-acyltransferase PlsY [Mesomycoplasma neurolyticum]VEU59445.1 G3P acyltransferase [Mesomycoplasma neurolyticum]
MPLWLNIILINLSALVVGYLIGSINISIILTKLKYKKDIREQGSNNAGSTNVLRVHGTKVALPIFIFDILKSFFCLMFFALLQKHLNNNIAFKYIIPQFSALGAVVGHIWPIYFNFKGGKGAACLLGAFLGINIIIVIIGIIIFLTIVLTTKYVSLGSIVAPFILIMLSFIPWIIMGPLGYLNWQDKYTLYWINTLILLVSYIFVVYSHKANIVRLLNKKENKLSLKRK